MHELSIIYGTQNNAKIEYMKQLLSALPIKINGLPEGMEQITESGNSPLENSRIKAFAYYQQLKQPVFSCDSGLLIYDIPTESQVGTYIRRMNGKSLSDEEMIIYYSNLAAGQSGHLTAYYQNAICMVWNESVVFEHSGDDIASETFYLLKQPHKKRIAGFPLDSLSAEISSGKYYYDLADYSYSDGKSAEGFRAFFNQVLCKLRAGNYFEY